MCCTSRRSAPPAPAQSRITRRAIRTAASGSAASRVTLLAGVSGVTCVDLPETEVCCGFGGLFAVKMADISGAMLGRKLDAIEESGADVVTGTDVSCLMHIGGGLRRRGSRVRVKHLAEILAPGELP